MVKAKKNSIKVYLERITYGGESIGDDTAFTIQVSVTGLQPDVKSFPAKVKPGKTRELGDSCVFSFEEDSSKEPYEVKAEVLEIIETDKYNDYMSSSKQSRSVKVDSSKKSVMSFSLVKNVSERRSDGPPKPGAKTATFTFDFKTVVEPL